MSICLVSRWMVMDFPIAGEERLARQVADRMVRHRSNSQNCTKRHSRLLHRTWLFCEATRKGGEMTAY